MRLIKRTLSIRISGRQRKERVSNLLYSLAHFRNLLIIFNQIYKKIYGKFILNESYLYALLSDKLYNPRGRNKDKKLREFKEILENIENSSELKYFLNQLKQQKGLIKNNYIIQTLIIQLVKDYKSYFRSIQKYKKSPKLFNTFPKPPKAKKLKDIPSFTAELNLNTFKVLEDKRGKYLLIKLINDKKDTKYLKVKLPKKFDYLIKSVRIKFVSNDVYVDVVYEKEKKDIEDKNREHLAGIDLGLNNLITLFSTNEKLRTLIISGKELKSINQWFNKEKAKLQSRIELIQNQINKLNDKDDDIESLKKEKLELIEKQRQLSAYRNRWITDVFHKITRKIADFLKETGHKEVYIGKGATESKRKIDLGKRTNQNFVNIPFRKLINQLKYKLEEYGIKLIETSEEFTSKTSPFANLRDVIKLWKEYLKAKKEKNEKLLYELKEKLKQQCKGKRVKRGLFKDFTLDKIFNADAVGSYNIIRKEIQPLINEKVLIDKLSRPIKLKLNEILNVTCKSLISICLDVEDSR